MTRSRTSSRWLKAHFNDACVRAAHKQGYRSRAVYKLLEIDQRDRLLHRGMTVIDLGAAPGSWSQYCVERLGATGRVIALDILPMQPLPGVEVLQADFRDAKTLTELINRVEGRPVHLVLSDMAPNISGVTAIDQPRAMRLAEEALELACQVLVGNGSFLIKGFQGEGFDDYLQRLRECFRKVVIRKPKASRERSREVYLLARHAVCSKV
ncbi:23S rRNA (uridine(2552)-2'-O)-methyltransferase RlmE [Nitrococcus mobilis]|uniref:23S rRNA (uridine(2552)-2'-O)-methyltransferase RlmE n=1 Tax=Nitrococcus mobilis TaxID=35797 RepID=UPI0018DCA5E5|nr:23S rRNA (uridine(2552)-2'-O)-methyltransferase RlmE [Nitrococcus mobilis]